MDPLCSLISEAGIIATWAYASQTYFTIAAFINPVVLSLNRFTGVVFFLNDKKISNVPSSNVRPQVPVLKCQVLK
uniref:Serpentine receptor class gamma n=1 Tax=Acrobeloides nanus TaxID=290746 RepID=A0A914EDI7_9BILA